MKCELIIKKGKKVKSGIVTVNTSMKRIATAFHRVGWQVIYFEPITDIQEDKDTKFVDVGVNDAKII